jgi:type IV pilus assembly protein PilY1
MICGLDDECGTNVSEQMGKNTGSQSKYDCKYVGQGVLSKVIIFAGKIFANIAGQTDCTSITDAAKKKECEKTKDLVQIDAAVGDIDTFRSSWRHNF